MLNPWRLREILGAGSLPVVRVLAFRSSVALGLVPFLGLKLDPEMGPGFLLILNQNSCQRRLGCLILMCSLWDISTVSFAAQAPAWQGHAMHSTCSSSKAGYD